MKNAICDFLRRNIILTAIKFTMNLDPTNEKKYVRRNANITNRCRKKNGWRTKFIGQRKFPIMVIVLANDEI